MASSWSSRAILRPRTMPARIASRLQQVLDDWNFLSPQLEDLAATLNGGKARHAFPFEPAKCMAPLPRAYQWADGSAFVNHVELVRRARNAEMPASFWTDPLMYQGGSDDFLGPRDDIVAGSDRLGHRLRGRGRGDHRRRRRWAPRPRRRSTASAW